MTDSKIIKILSQVYQYSNKEKYDIERKITTYKLPDKLKQNDIVLLRNSGFEINKIEHYQHDKVVKELKKFIAENDIEQTAYNLFLKAVGTGFHRGLQTIISYLYAKNVPEHTFEIFDEGYFRNPCRICGLPKESWENVGKNLHDLYIGHCRIGGYTDVLLDLKEILTFGNIKATDEDIKVFNKLMLTIEHAAEMETPTDLLNRISKEKILPNSNNTSRTWLIRILAELGILRNKLVTDYSRQNDFIPYYQILEWEKILHNEATNHRAEVTFPLSAWRGKLGVNHGMAEQVITIAKRII